MPVGCSECRTSAGSNQRGDDLALRSRQCTRFRAFRGQGLSGTCGPGSGETRNLEFLLQQHEQNWKLSNAVLRQALDSLTNWIGPYPYAQLSVVDVDDIAGRDMEYPTIVAIGACSANQFLQTLYHEAAHQWFYGMLGSNERRHPWMDEGWTTYLENRLYLNTQRLVSSPKESKFSQWLRLSDEPEDFLPHLRLHYLKGASRNSIHLPEQQRSSMMKATTIRQPIQNRPWALSGWKTSWAGMSSTLRCAITTGNGRSGIHSRGPANRVFERVSGKTGLVFRRLDVHQCKG